jgi:hypothetical protein
MARIGIRPVIMVRTGTQRELEHGLNSAVIAFRGLVEKSIDSLNSAVYVLDTALIAPE